MEKQTVREKVNSFLFNHLWLKYFIDYSAAFFLSVLSAAIFAFGLNTFLAPNIGSDVYSLVSGGSSGFAQVISKIFELFGIGVGVNGLFAGSSLVYSIAYLCINIPIIILAFKGIGKRFGLFTLVNVGFVFLFANLFKGSFFDQIAVFVNNNGGALARALFAGVCTGISSAIAFKIEASAGGFDVVSYYFSLKNGNNTGPYIAVINAIVIASYAGINLFSRPFGEALGGVFYSIVYLLAVVLIVDAINVRNKKAKVEIVTNDEKMPELLIAYVPHGATLFKGKGVYSGQERFVIEIVVSINEVKKVTRVARKLDPQCFVSVSNLQQVYGRFHMKPIK